MSTKTETQEKPAASTASNQEELIEGLQPKSGDLAQSDMEMVLAVISELELKIVAVANSQESTAQASGMEAVALITALRSEISGNSADLKAEIAELRGQLGALPNTNKKGMFAQTIAAATCPQCGLRLIGGSMTAAKGTQYEHPFDMPTGGIKCEFRGQKFHAPRVFLELVETPAKKAN